MLCLDKVNVIKVTDEDATIIHSMGYDRSERVGILPGFDIDNFPFIMRHNYVVKDKHSD